MKHNKRHLRLVPSPRVIAKNPDYRTITHTILITLAAAAALATLLVLSTFASKATAEIFPTVERPTASYSLRPRSFSAPRSGGRLHAACDLYQTSKGQQVRAVASGKVIRSLYPFYQGTFALEVKHDGYIVRYGEITGRKPAGIFNGAKVKAGDLIGYVGKVNSNCCDPMLHFERYKGNRTGNLTQRHNLPYQRRADLENPTTTLQQWEQATFGPNNPLPILTDIAPPLPQRRSPLPKDVTSYPVLLRALTNYGQTDSTPEELSTYLDAHGYMAQTLRDENPETGAMITVRTHNHGWAAHNFIAQYLEEDDGSNSVQHMSFELRPDVKSLAEVVQSLNATIPLLGAPEFANAGFVQWNLGNGYILWAKELEREDLEENPFYEYSEQEIGSIRVTVELDPHS